LDPEDFFRDKPASLASYRKVHDFLQGIGPVDIRATKSQVAFRRKRGFAYLWLPGRWLRNPSTELVLSIARRQPIESRRFKEVAHPARTVWMHHLEVPSPEALDDEVFGWLRDAYREAG
jgi:hypothetical protein